MKDKIKRYSLYTFNKSKLVWTDTENLRQAILNFKNRLNLDHNGYNHPNMEYVMNPFQVITVDNASDNVDSPSSKKTEETILSFNCELLQDRLINGYKKEESNQLEFNFNQEEPLLVELK